MKKNKFFLLLLFVISLTSGAIAQTTNVRVESIFNLGTFEFAYVYDLTEQVYYKTAAYTTGELAVESTYEMQYLDPTVNFDGLISETGENIYLELIKTESFSLPMSSQYGMPVEVNGILFFQNEEHYAEMSNIVYDFINSQYEEEYDLVQVFEDEFPNFVSLNDYLETTFGGYIRGTSYEQLLEREQEDFIKDFVDKAFINSNYEVGIGNDVYVHFKNEMNVSEIITAKVPKTSTDILEDFREVSKITFPIGLLSYDVEFFRGDKVVTKASVVIPVTDLLGLNTYDLTYTSDVVNFVKVCDLGNEVNLQISLIRDILVDGLLYIDNSLLEGIVTVNFGDGTSEQVPFDYTDFVTTTGEALKSTIKMTTPIISHSYASPGAYIISHKIDFTSEKPLDIDQELYDAADNFPVDITVFCSLNGYKNPSTSPLKVEYDGGTIYSLYSTSFTNTNYQDRKMISSVANFQFDAASNSDMPRDADNLQLFHSSKTYENDCISVDQTKTESKDKDNFKVIQLRTYFKGNISHLSTNVYSTYDWSDYGAYSHDGKYVFNYCTAGYY